MKLYLSSYELGNKTDTLREMVPENNKLAYIFNALDFTNADPERKQKRVERNMSEIAELGFDCFELDLKKYFGKQGELRELVATLGAIWASGGNTFVLRQAYKLSGFDEILMELNKQDDFLYGGYSAGVCVLGPTLDGYHLVDDATDTPFDGFNEVLWDGLGIIDYMFLPHFKSDHPESEDIDNVLEYCKEKKFPYKPVRDGEVIIVT